MTRDKPKDWRAGSKPGGLAIRCFAEEAARAPGGLWYPARIVGEVFEGEEIVRRTTMAVRLGELPAAAPRLELPGGKRKVDPWPKYRASVYLRRLAAGDLDHANRLGLAASLAYEGADVPGTIEAVADAIAALEADPGLLGETFGGIDWELGFAVYECFWRVSEAEAAGVWAALPATSTWSAVLAKAVDLYGQYRPEERDRIATLLGGYGSTYAERRKAEVRKIQRERYRASLWEDLALRRALGEAEAAAHLERVLGELDRAGAE